MDKVRSGSQVSRRGREVFEMEELQSMIIRAMPWNWNAPKVASAVLLIFIILSWRMIRNNRVKPHAWLMCFTLFVLISVSVHGVMQRGVMGTLATEVHTDFYKAVAYTHLSSGGLYFLLGLLQVEVFVIIRKRTAETYKFHRVLGRVAASCAILSITCLFLLK